MFTDYIKRNVGSKLSQNHSWMKNAGVASEVPRPGRETKVGANPPGGDPSLTDNTLT
jgi:hypothetical protein